MRKRSRHTNFQMDPTAFLAIEGDEKAEEGPPDSPTSVYYLFTPDHVLLYVGITSRSTARLGDHSHDKDWWQQVGYASFEHFASRAEAEAREYAAIEHMKPLKNKVSGQRNPSHYAINPKPRICTFPDCADPIHAKRLCHRHYVRQWRAAKEAS